jgi:hypothetical protein
MRNLIATLFAGALFGSTCIAVAADAQTMDESTNPNSGTDMPTENMQQKPDETSANDASSKSYDKKHMKKHRSERTANTMKSGTNNKNSNSDVSGADQIESGSAGSTGEVEKLRQKPNEQQYQ